MRKTQTRSLPSLNFPEMQSVKIEDFSNGTCEALATTHQTLDLTIITAYGPPDTTESEFDDLLIYIDTNLSNIQIKKKSNQYFFLKRL